MNFQEGSNNSLEGAAAVATVSEAKAKSIPVRISESVARGKGYAQHLRDLRKQYDRDVQEREAAHTRLVNEGTGPVGHDEIQKLQKSRWKILGDNEAGLLKLIAEAQDIASNREEEHCEAQRLIRQFHDELLATLISDFRLPKPVATVQADSNPQLVSIRQTALEIHRQHAAVKQAIAAMEESVQAIADERAKLSRKWRSI